MKGHSYTGPILTMVIFLPSVPMEPTQKFLLEEEIKDELLSGVNNEFRKVNFSESHEITS